MSLTIEEAAERIHPLDAKAQIQARSRWDSRAKLPGSLGELEWAVVRLAGIRRTPSPSIGRKQVVVFCADNGVTAESVTPSDPRITAAQAVNFAEGGGTINAFARRLGADVLVVDIGIATPCRHPGILRRSIRPGTGNIAYGPAMTAEECRLAVETGIALAEDAASRGVDLLITGEMGIGNTTTSSAVAAVLLGRPPEEVASKGAGRSGPIPHKAAVIRRAIGQNRPDPGNPLNILAKVGGLDLAGMCGLYIGGAACGLPVVIDGVISAAAALCAVRIAPLCQGYMLPSHCSAEPAGRLLLDALGFRAPIQAGLCLGEGTGGVLGAALLDYALSAYLEVVDLADL